MPFIEKVSVNDVLDFIIEFYQKYQKIPNANFIAEVKKVTSATIYRKLNELENRGIVKKIKKAQNVVEYELIIKQLK